MLGDPPFLRKRPTCATRGCCWLQRRHFAAAILCLAALTLFLIPSRILCPWPLGIVEPSVLVGVERVVRGESLYRAYWESPPLNPLPYGVAEYLVPGLIGRWAHLVEPIELIRIGRVVSLAGFLVAAALCMVAARGFGAGRMWPVAAAGGLFAVPAAMEWATKLAPDMPALALSLAGWLLARRLLKPGTRLGQLAIGALTAACWTAAFHFKPTVVPGPVALSVEMVFLFLAGKRPWLLFAWSSVALGASVVIALILQWATGGLYWANAGGSMAVCRYSIPEPRADRLPNRRQRDRADGHSVGSGPSEPLSLSLAGCPCELRARAVSRHETGIECELLPWNPRARGDRFRRLGGGGMRSATLPAPFPSRWRFALIAAHGLLLCG